MYNPVIFFFKCNKQTLLKYINLNISFKKCQGQTFYGKKTWGFLTFIWKSIRNYNNLLHIFNDDKHVSAYVYIRLDEMTNGKYFFSI